MRIGLAIQHFRASVGGAEAYGVAVMQRLAAAGHSILVVCTTGDEVPWADVRVEGMMQAPRIWRDWGAEATIDWGLRVPAHLRRLGGGVRRELFRYGELRHPVWWRWVRAALRACSARQRRAFRREKRLLTDEAGDILAVSTFVAEQVRRRAGPCEDRLHVLFNGVDATRFHPPSAPAEREAVRRDWGLRPEDIAFLFVAHNTRLKNLALLRRVFRGLAETCPRIRLVLVGKRRPRFNAPWFVYAGATDRPEEAYRAGDALVHPTFYDACANVVTEAMASGLPVVSSDQNGSAARIDSDETGWVLPVAGKQVDRDWAGVIRRLSESAELRQQVGGRAARRASQWSMDRYVQDFEQILLSALRRQGLDGAAALLTTKETNG